MKLFKKLMGKHEPETPTWDIKPAGERPTPRTAPKTDNADAVAVATAPTVPRPQAKQPAKEKNPFLDDEMLDTMSLVADDLIEEDPFATQSLEQIFDGDSRRLRNTPISKAAPKKAQEQNNPYDTGSMHRGWKK
jgi:hypothetical protein